MTLHGAVVQEAILNIEADAVAVVNFNRLNATYQVLAFHEVVGDFLAVIVAVEACYGFTEFKPLFQHYRGAVALSEVEGLRAVFGDGGAQVGCLCLNFLGDLFGGEDAGANSLGVEGEVFHEVDERGCLHDWRPFGSWKI